MPGWRPGRTLLATVKRYKEYEMLQNTIIVREPRRVAVAGLLIATMLGFSAPTLLSASEFPKERVRISDLDLATPKGQHEFERRLDVAIGHLCAAPDSHLPPTPIAQRNIDACRAKARDDAQRQLQAHGIQVMVAARSEGGGDPGPAARPAPAAKTKAPIS
jgi:UrcA family protein